MKFPFISLTRRQALASVAVTASAAANQQGAILATLVPLRKQNEKELLLRMALTRDYVFVLWSSSPGPRGASRLACYGVDGAEKWSDRSLLESSASLFAIMASSENEVLVASVDLTSSSLKFEKYNWLGPMNQRETLPLNRAVLAVAANNTDICALDVATSLSRKRFGDPEEPIQLPAAFDVPAIGGIRPRALVASAHYLGSQLILLDHVKARTVTFTPNGERRSGRLVHPSIEAAIQKQDSDVQSRAALLRSSGNEGAITFPLSISLAADDHIDAIWVASSLRTGIIPLLRFSSAMTLASSLNIEIPSGSIIRDRPPQLLAASPSTLALGFREGTLALASYKGEE